MLITAIEKPGWNLEQVRAGLCFPPKEVILAHASWAKTVGFLSLEERA